MQRERRVAILIGVMCIAASACGAATTREAVRQRLVDAAAASKALMDKSEALPKRIASTLVMQRRVPEDGETKLDKRFARTNEVKAYLKARPWSVAYGDSLSDPQAWPAVVVENGLGAAEAPALRELLKDDNPQVRSLAVEVLGALALPEDPPRIAELLGDEAAAAPVLGWWYSEDARWPMPYRIWHTRRVSTYAREALKLMTGHRFDAQDPADLTFAQWWRTHDKGRESLWYWEQRMEREARAVVLIERREGEGEEDFSNRQFAASDERRQALYRATMKEIGALNNEVKIKIFLLSAEDSGPGIDLTGPVNPLFPQGLPLTIPSMRLSELIAGKDLWPEVAEVPFGRKLMLSRLAAIMDDVTRTYGAPMIPKEQLATALEREAPTLRSSPVLISRLKPPGDVNDPDKREGYLRQALARTNEGFTREKIAAEMVRQNLTAQWPELEKVFYSEQHDRGETSDARTGILKALGEPPHTEEKARRLAELIEDPRNESLLTQENQVMGMDQYRLYAMRGVNAISGKQVVTNAIEQGFKQRATAMQSLRELRRLAREAANSMPAAASAPAKPSAKPTTSASTP